MDCTIENERLVYTPTTEAERHAFETGYHDHKVGRSPQLAPYTGPLYNLWLAGWDAAQQGQELYTLESGQVYTLNQSGPNEGTLEIEIVQLLQSNVYKERDRVTFAVWELSPHGPRTAQGSATVPISWLLVTLGAHRAELLSECTGHAPVY